MPNLNDVVDISKGGGGSLPKVECLKIYPLKIWYMSERHATEGIPLYP